MSGTLGYWPFDYNRYTRDVLPAFVQMMQGDARHMQALIVQAKIGRLPLFMPWGRPDLAIYNPVYLSAPDWSELEEQTREPGEIRFGFDCRWAMLLHLRLIYTFCCTKPIESTGIFKLGDDESLANWKRFAAYNEEGRRLWDLFYTTPTAAICQDILYLPLDKDYPRALDPFVDCGMHGTPMGFITPKETQILHMYMQKHAHGRPSLLSPAQPVEIQQVEHLREQEDDLLTRLDYAVAHAWGMLMYIYPGDR